MADEQVKAMTADIETPVFEQTAFTTPKPLREATVAIVTSASLHHPDDDDFAPGDTGYRVLSAARRDYVMGHWSPNFDTTGFAVDINTVFPIDRLDELVPQYLDDPGTSYEELYTRIVSTARIAGEDVPSSAVIPWDDAVAPNIIPPEGFQ